MTERGAGVWPLVIKTIKAGYKRRKPHTDRRQFTNNGLTVARFHSTMAAKQPQSRRH